MKTLLAIATASLAALSIASAAEYPDISIKELKKAITDKKVIVIDVNGTASFSKGHIPTAIDYTAKKDELGKLLESKDKDTLVVAYCGGPTCNAYKQGADKAKELGFKNVKHLSAGISGWMQAGEKTEKAKEKKETEKAS